MFELYSKHDHEYRHLFSGVSLVHSVQSRRGAPSGLKQAEGSKLDRASVKMTAFSSDTDNPSFFSDVVPGDNLAVMCFKIKATIEREQKKTLWIPAGSL